MTEPLTIHTLAPAAPAWDHDPLIADNIRCLEQGIDVVRELPEGLYSAPGLVGSPIGSHFRHVLDHYTMFLEGLASGVMHYEGRRRDPQVETEREVGLALAAELAQRLRGLTSTLLARPLRVRCLTGVYAEDVHGDHPSSVPRELHFLMLHTVHHYSYIAAELKLRGHRVSPEFGIAPATLQHRRAQS